MKLKLDLKICPLGKPIWFVWADLASAANSGALSCPGESILFSACRKQVLTVAKCQIEFRGGEAVDFRADIATD